MLAGTLSLCAHLACAKNVMSILKYVCHHWPVGHLIFERNQKKNLKILVHELVIGLYVVIRAGSITISKVLTKAGCVHIITFRFYFLTLLFLVVFDCLMAPLACCLD